jgi:2'-5' RNA ligase/phage portal protein BeeE
MSRRYRKPKSKSTAPRATPDIERAYQELIRALQQAETRATETVRVTGQSREQVIDLREAGNVLHRYPKLASYLDGMKQRELARQDALVRPDLALSHSPTGSTPQASPIASGWSGTKDMPNYVNNARMLRQLADTNPWARAAINVRRQQIGRADIAVVPKNPLKPYNKKLLKEVEHLLNQPNEMRDSYRSLIEPVIEDILVLDRGVISKDMNAQRRPQGLYYEDGATIAILANWQGNPNDYRYIYTPAAQTGPDVPLRNDECIVFIANSATHRYGLSPVQVLYDTLLADQAAAKSARAMVDQKPPPHLIQLLNATAGQILNLRTMYEQELMGRKELFLLGGSAEARVHPLTQSARDNQWLEWQIFILRKIAAIFQVSPQQLGITFDINKATGDSQQQIFEDTGLIPLLLLLEEQLNRELLFDFAPRLARDRVDMDALNLRIVYPEVSETARQLHAERANVVAKDSLNGLPSMTLNQVLDLRGDQPVPGGNTFYVATRFGPVPWLSYDGGNTGDYNPPPLAGGMGSQDPAGGLSDEPDPQSGTGKSNVPLADQRTTPGGIGQNAATNTKALIPDYQANAVSNNTGAMVALMIPQDIAKQLALPGGEPSGDLHITLAYLGDKNDAPQNFLTPFDKPNRLKQAIASVASENIPLSGTVAGIGRFNPEEDGGLTPVYASVDIPGLSEFRTRLVAAIEREHYFVAKNHGFTPHITLAYIDADAPMPIESVPALSLDFDTVTLVICDERMTFPLGDEQYPTDQPQPSSTQSVLLNRFDYREPGKRWTPNYYLRGDSAYVSSR